MLLHTNNNKDWFILDSASGKVYIGCFYKIKKQLKFTIHKAKISISTATNQSGEDVLMKLGDLSRPERELLLDTEVWSTDFWAVSPVDFAVEVLNRFSYCQDPDRPIELVYSHGGLLHGTSPVIHNLNQSEVH